MKKFKIPELGERTASAMEAQVVREAVKVEAADVAAEP
jgi:hypothetical protein